MLIVQHCFNIFLFCLKLIYTYYVFLQLFSIKHWNQKNYIISDIISDV